MILALIFFFFFNDTATTEIYTLSLHDALPISFFPTNAVSGISLQYNDIGLTRGAIGSPALSGSSPCQTAFVRTRRRRSEEHTSELQSQSNLVCRLLLEKKKNTSKTLRLSG